MSINVLLDNSMWHVSYCQQLGQSLNTQTLYIPRAPGPYPQVRWLDPPGTHPNHLRNGGRPGALGYHNHNHKHSDSRLPHIALRGTK